MRRFTRVLGTLLVFAGVVMLVWAGTVWRWQDPVTAVYTHMEQRELLQGYEERLAAYSGARLASDEEPDDEPRPEEVRAAIREAAAEYRKSLRPGEAVGRLLVPRLGLEIVVVEGTDDLTLRRGPGRHEKTYVPGEGELVYVAGHRTTYSAPFARIDELRPGDVVVLEVPYGRFEYRIARHRIVHDRELSVLESGGDELLALQACHPRFFATHRYIAYAEPVSVTPPDGEALPIAVGASATD